MRAVWAVLLLALPALSGCLSFLEPEDPDADREVAPPRDVPDPAHVEVTGVRVYGEPDDPLTITSFDGVPLSAVVYEPMTPDALPNGSAPAFPVVIFVHGWGDSKEQYQNVQFAPTEQPVDLLERFAREGFVTVAYDVRGFGQSGGQAAVVGPAEMQDLDVVRQYVQERFLTTDYVGVVGQSYGGAHALNAWAKNPHVTTVAAHQGWTDLYDALLPGNVVKAEWGVSLMAKGTGGAVVPGQEGSAGNLHPMVYRWLEDAALRQNLEQMEAEMDARSVGDLLERTQKPLFLCQGLQESLFPQFHEALLRSGGFTRAYVHTGGHGTHDAGCYDRTVDWFRFFLLGDDNGVDQTPFLESVDADSANPVLTFTRDDLESARDDASTYFLREPELVAFSSGAEFTVEQRVLANPLAEPSVIWDQAGMSYNPVPHQARFEEQDPTSVFFTTKPFDGSAVVLGAPELTLHLADQSVADDFQVTAALFHVIDDEGSESSRVLARGAYAYVNGTTKEHDGTIHVPMDWTKATIQSGDRLLLRLNANENGYYLPLQANYATVFTGESSLSVPYFA